MKHNYQKKYKNVLIRQIEQKDIEIMRQWRNNPNNSRYLRKIPFITEEMQIKWYNNYLYNTDEMCFAIEEIENLHRVVGSLSLYNFFANQAEYGKVLIGDKEAHGKNVGVNSLKAVLYIAFTTLKLKRIILHVYKENIPAVKVYTKVGFKEIDSYIANGLEEITMEITAQNYR